MHGGGPEINTWLDKLGIKAEFKNGLRVTDGKVFQCSILSMCSLMQSSQDLCCPFSLLKSRCKFATSKRHISGTLTAAATMDVVEMVLGGRVNKGLVTLIQQAGGQAVGLCGKDSNIIRARQMVEKDIGFVGDITSVKKDLIVALVKEEYIPVVASVAADPLTGQALNVNADIAAGEVMTTPTMLPRRQADTAADTCASELSVDPGVDNCPSLCKHCCQ